MLIFFQAIYSKIKDLNFHDCHTKIRQVDSHSTVGGGVVVQVNMSVAFSLFCGAVKADLEITLFFLLA